MYLLGLGPSQYIHLVVSTAFCDGHGLILLVECFSKSVLGSVTMLSSGVCMTNIFSPFYYLHLNVHMLWISSYKFHVVFFFFKLFLKYNVMQPLVF